MPTRACLPLLTENLIKNTTKEPEDICNDTNLEPYIAYGELDGDFLSEIMIINKEGLINLYWNNGTTYKQLSEQSL